MCLAIPGKIVSIESGDFPFCTGTVDFGGILKQINLSFVPEAKIGDYVIAHVGIAIQRLDEKAALETQDLIQEGFADEVC